MDNFQAIPGPGQPLLPSIRRFVEPRFGTDFSDVRVHTGSQAAVSAKTINARAYTYGNDIVFGSGQYSPNTRAGRHLLAHELTHIVQQSYARNPIIGLQTNRRISRLPLDLTRLDEELFWGDPLTQNQGEIGFGATRGRRLATPTEDSSLPINAFVFPRNTVSSQPSTSGSNAPSPSPTGPRSNRENESTTANDQSREVSQPRQNRSLWRRLPSGIYGPSRRALVVGGIHGSERGPLDIARQLLSELRSGTNPLARDFDTIVISEMNPGGVADGNRKNRRQVDLNRNFPGLRGFPSPPRGRQLPPRQPEVKAVMNVVDTIKPYRIVALHAVNSSRSGGVYADPQEGDVARELACRTAIRMRGQRLPNGRMRGDINISGNQLPNNVCNVRYPGSVTVTSGQSTFGSWASAPSAIGGAGSIPTITHEVSQYSPLPASGSGRSVATIMPGIREFLLDNEHLPSEADTIVRRAVTNAFLTGQGRTSGERQQLLAIQRIVSRRFRDLANHYRARMGTKAIHSTAAKIAFAIDKHQPVSIIS